MIGRSRAARKVVATAATAAICLLVVSTTVGSVANASKGHARQARQNGTWVSGWDWGTWVFSGPPCNCWYHPALAIDSSTSNPVLLNNSTLKLYGPVVLSPGGVEVASPLSISTYPSGNVLVGAGEYSLSKDRKTATLVRGITAPSGADGSRIAIVGGNSGTPAMQELTFTKGGAQVGKAYDIPMGHAIDVNIHRKTQACSNGLTAPPIALEANNTDLSGPPDPGRPMLMACKQKELTGHVTLIK